MRALAPSTLPLLLTLIVAAPAIAQDAAASDPSDVDPVAPAEDPASDPEPEPEPEPEPPAQPTDLERLREIESRLSVGHPLLEEERSFLVQAAQDARDPEARALAAAILPWLPPQMSRRPLTVAAADEDPRVRHQAVQGLVAIARRVDDDGRRRIASVAAKLLADEDDEVACGAARLLALVDPTGAPDEVRKRAADASDLRHACWRRLVPLEPRAVTTPPPKPLIPDEIATPEPEQLPAPPAPPTGKWLFVATAASVGFLGGGALPGVFLPPRDTLTYTERRTVHTREEPSLFFAGSVAVGGGALLGGAAFGLTLLTDELEVPAATAVVVSSASGAIGGLGAGLAAGLNGPLTGGTAVAGAVSGLVLQSALGLTMPPAPNDIGAAVAFGGQAASAGLLLSLTLVPWSQDEVWGGGPLRHDFALGVGLLSGGAVTVGSLAFAPLLDLSPTRLLAASAAGLSAASLGLGLTYLFTPVAIGPREQIASGVGVALQLIAFPAALVLFPADWADALDGVVSPEGSALVVDDGALKVGLPALRVLPTPEGGSALGVGLLSGRW
jgi:hypothetical protein